MKAKKKKKRKKEKRETSKRKILVVEIQFRLNRLLYTTRCAIRRRRIEEKKKKKALKTKKQKYIYGVFISNIRLIKHDLVAVLCIAKHENEKKSN